MTHGHNNGIAAVTYLQRFCVSKEEILMNTGVYTTLYRPKFISKYFILHSTGKKERNECRLKQHEDPDTIRIFRETISLRCAAHFA